MITKSELEDLYLKKGNSMQAIAKRLRCSSNRVKYWMSLHQIPIRTISQAVYLKHNPEGDPFKIKKLSNSEDHFLMGLGLGLYWGEGTKSNKYSVRLGNTDPALIKAFIKFLSEVFSISKKDLRFGLQLFNDINPREALAFWQSQLGVDPAQFQKVVKTPSRGEGTYKRKIKHGVLTVYYHNKKLRDMICGELKNIGFRD